MNDSRVRLPEPVVWHFDVGEQLRLIEMLSPREMEVLRLVAEGLPDKEIGATLYVRRRTVRTHVSNIMQKLGARSRTDAVRIALQVGLFQSREPTSVQAAIALSAYYATLAQKLLQEGQACGLRSPNTNCKPASLPNVTCALAKTRYGA